MLTLFNHYSAPIMAGLVWLGLAAVIRRRGGRARDWLYLAAVLVGVIASWYVLRPVARPVEPVAGRPVLLEIQSPYCLGCLALKPSVDRLETELQDRLVVQRVNLQGETGRRLAQRHEVDRTPTFILFDPAGNELWRASGRLDAAAIRSRLGGT